MMVYSHVGSCFACAIFAVLFSIGLAAAQPLNVVVETFASPNCSPGTLTSAAVYPPGCQRLVDGIDYVMFFCGVSLTQIMQQNYVDATCGLPSGDPIIYRRATQCRSVENMSYRYVCQGDPMQYDEANSVAKYQVYDPQCRTLRYSIAYPAGCSVGPDGTFVEVMCFGNVAILQIFSDAWCKDLLSTQRISTNQCVVSFGGVEATEWICDASGTYDWHNGNSSAEAELTFTTFIDDHCTDVSTVTHYLGGCPNTGAAAAGGPVAVPPSRQFLCQENPKFPPTLFVQPYSDANCQILQGPAMALTTAMGVCQIYYEGGSFRYDFICPNAQTSFH